VLRNFYAGSAPGVAINNCGTEGTNGSVKDWVGRNASASFFFDKMGSYLQNHSSRRDAGSVSPIIWSPTPTISQSTWVSANFMYQQNKKEYRESDYQIVTYDNVHYMIVSRDGNPQYYTGDDLHRETYVRGCVEAYIDNSWPTMAAFYHFVQYENIVVRKADTHWLCHCELCTRQFVCDHVLCVKLNLKLVTMSRGALTFKHQNRGRGRTPGSNKYTKCDEAQSPPPTPVPTAANADAECTEDTEDNEVDIAGDFSTMFS
jgi:hypothetical protein